MEASIRYLTTDWDAKLKHRFPNGVPVRETPFLKMCNNAPDFVALQRKMIREEGERRIEAAVKSMAKGY
jgi:hypothetical protein